MPRDEGSSVAQDGRVERVRRAGERMASDRRENSIMILWREQGRSGCMLHLRTMRMWTNSGVWSRVAHPTSRALKMHLILFCDGSLPF